MSAKDLGPPYDQASFWDERYARDHKACWEWLGSYSSWRSLLRSSLGSDVEVLVLGCGNSRLVEDLYDDGVRNVTGIDFSAVVINQMKERIIGKDELEFMVMDCRRLRFPSGTFDLVIDKGVSDCVICGLNGTVDARKMMSQVHSALKPGGIYSVMSCGSPSKRLDLLQSVPVRWSKVEYTSIHAKRGSSGHVPSPPGSPSSQSKGRIYYYHCVK
eukprot:TRINITY_DN81570_c0_g1_i1.p1 TRINITY_DN81570_c0_g1~~TRINITY_DN81570_c0_g1_i1.p1  ORF type:complete len:215 (-),score=47.41 TRINITY_DN81570_c0_g1_i1:87-731(-)